MGALKESLRSTAHYLSSHGAGRAKVGLVLGSGLGAFGDRLDDSIATPYSQIPGFPTSSVAGHRGQFITGTLGGIPVAVLQGRVHRYEGWPWADVVFPVRVLGTLGIETVVLTNAAGGITQGFQPGDLMRITDHLNLTGGNPLVGENDPAMGPRFPDMTEAWDRAVGEQIEVAAGTAGVPLKRGVYAGLLGPTYETPSEIKMLRTLGADAVGMSTVAECIALRHMGVRVGGISCITNLAAGLSETLLSHDEVKETADKAEQSFVGLLEAVVPLLAGLGT